ncbi:MAG: CxxxxCH/CxxCH domain-containing protein [Geobacteraceae bacterium]|nr:CxxxxCH/CxxCH domain-containing protein [Geobacteraceae bacterium]
MKQQITRYALSLAFLAFSLPAANAAMQCNGCHGTSAPVDYRPLDEASRNPVTGGVQGNHRTHMDAPAAPAACDTCHPGSSAYISGHRDGKIKLSARINNSPHTTTYKNSTSAFNQSATPSLGSCNNVNCHFENVTPTWGSDPAATSCSTCHTTPPGGGSSGAAGSHARHAQYYPGTANCLKCHANNTGFQHATSAGNRNLVISFAAAPNNGSGAYSGALNDYLPSQSNSFGNCTATYCHSPGTKSASFNPPNQTATWGGTLGCAGCHAATPATGSHAGHVSTTYGVPVACHKCHAATVTSGMTIYSTSRHVNKLVNIAFNSSTTAIFGKYSGHVTPMQKNPGSGYANCENVYCHSNGQNPGGTWPPTYSSPKWGAAATGECGTCHDHGYHGGVALISSGSHGRHMGYNFGTDSVTRCGVCHYGSAFATPSCSLCHFSSALTDLHVNHRVDVSFVTKFGGTYNGTPEPGDGYSSCSNVYCHSNGTSVSSGTVPGNTSANWGSAVPLTCNSCHGNSTYTSDWRKAMPAYTTGNPKGNAHARHIRTGTLSGDYMQCSSCHAATTRNNTSISDTSTHVSKSYNVTASVFGIFSSAFRDGDNTMNSTKVTLTHSYNASGSSCSNVSCHPIGLDITTAPPTPKTRATSSVKWNSSGVCIDCHNIDMQSTSTFHHAMRNYSAGYPLLAPYSSASNGINAYARRCTMCHVDHNIFSNDLNGSNTLGRAANLRTDIAVTPTATSGYSNKDYIKSGSGGICISCHNAARGKDTTRRKNDYPANATPAITQSQYSGSGHQYDVPARFMSDGSTVYGNCSKCHNALLNETSVFMNATSGYQFGNHNSGIRRLQGTLGAAGGETAEEQICYRCHSLISDADPGGGPPKTVADKDFYGVAPMSLASQDVFAANLDFRPANPTYSTTSKLYFKPVAAESPVEAMPNEHNTGDTFAGGTWIGRAMSPWETTIAYETKSQETELAGTNYWRMVSFISPKVYSTTTLPAGNWVINIYCRESSTYQNAKIRYKVYKWNDPADSIGATIIATGTNTTELATTSAPGSVRQIAVNVPATTLTAGEKIVVDLVLDTSSTITTEYIGSFYFGSHAPSNLTLPGNVNWSYADPGAAGFGHRTQHYSGIHLPSTRNESLDYISRNRHVECVDCHNPHATRNGLHGDYGTATGGSTTTLVNSNKNWVPNQWVGDFINIISGTGAGQTATISSNTATTITVPTWTAPASGSVYRITTNTNAVSRSQRGVPGASVSYAGSWTNGTYSLVNEATYEYEICFKCHAATNATSNTLRYWNVTSPSMGAARWTNIGLEFNPNNASYHPVVQALPATGNRRLSTAALTGGWAPGEVMSCSDCHGRDTGTSATAQGPHGSTVKWMLTGTYQNWPFTSATANGTAAGGTLLTGTGTTTVPASNFCFNCHTWAAGGYGHTKSSGGHNKACVNCHIRVPHGGKVPRLLTGPNAPPRYKPDGNGGAFSGAYLTSAVLPASGYMLATSVSCSSICGARHTDNSLKANYW